MSLSIKGRLAAAAAVLASVGAWANSYTIVDLGTGECPTALNRAGVVVGNNAKGAQVFRGGKWRSLSFGGAALAINRQGTAAGWQSTRRGPTIAMLWPHNADPVTISLPADPSLGLATGVNDSGTVVGYFQGGGGAYHCFLWTHDNGAVDLGGHFGECNAMAVNNNGDVTGLGTTTSWGNAFLWSNGAFTDLGTPAGTLGTYGLAINDKSHVVGRAIVDQQGHTEAFLWDGSMHGLDPQNEYYQSEASSINNSGQIVGWAIKANQTLRIAVRFDHGRIIHLIREASNPGNWNFEYANSINEKGEIAGCGAIDGQGHAFMLRPQKDS